MATFGFVSLWHDHTELLPHFRKLASAPGWDEICIVDNGGTGDTNNILWCNANVIAQETGKKVWVYRREQNSSVHAMNEGLRQLNTDVKAFIANDVYPLDDNTTWAIDMQNGLEQPGRYCQGACLASQHYIPYIDSYAVAMHAQDWQRLDYFDTEYIHPGYWVDVDLGWRAAKLGLEFRATCRLGQLGFMTSEGPEKPSFWKHFNCNHQLFMKRAGVEA